MHLCNGVVFILGGTFINSYFSWGYIYIGGIFILESRVLTSFNAKNHHQKVDSCEDAMYWFFLSMYKFFAFMVFSHWNFVTKWNWLKKPFTLTNFLFDLDTARPKWLPGRQVNLNLSFLYFTIIKVRKKKK